MSTRFNFENHPGYEKLKEAFSRSNRDFLNSIELVPEEDVYFSPQYEKKMAHLIKRQKRPYWKFVNTVGKKIAVIAIAFMMLFGLSMSIKAIREPVIGFIENVFEKFSELFVNKSEIKNAPDIIEEVYTLTDVPEGYEIIMYSPSPKIVVTTWSNGEKKIELIQSVLNMHFTIDTEETEVSKIEYDGQEIMYYHSIKNNNEQSQAFWHTENYSFEIFSNDFLSENDIIKLIETITTK